MSSTHPCECCDQICASMRFDAVSVAWLQMAGATHPPNIVSNLIFWVKCVSDMGPPSATRNPLTHNSAPFKRLHILKTNEHNFNLWNSVHAVTVAHTRPLNAAMVVNMLCSASPLDWPLFFSDFMHRNVWENSFRSFLEETAPRSLRRPCHSKQSWRLSRSWVEVDSFWPV